MIKKFPWFEVLLIISVMSISLYGAFSDAQNFSMQWFTRDDAYYYFKVAQNISEGHGSTFDGIDPTNGYHPLWMIICVPIFALARFDLVLPLRILLLVMSGLSVATGILLYRLLGKVFAPFVGALAALYWVFDSRILKVVYQQGLETGIAVLFIVLFIYKLFEFERSWRQKGVSKKELILLGAIGALTIFSRLDLVFFAGMAGIWVVFRGHAIRYYLPFDIVSIIYSALLAFIVRLGFPDYYMYTQASIVMVCAAMIIKLPLAYIFGLYQSAAKTSSLKTIKTLLFFTLASSVTVGLVVLILAKILNFSMPRSALVIDPIFSLILIGGVRFLHKAMRSETTGKDKAETPLQTLRANWKSWFHDGAIYFGTAYGLLGLYMIWNKIVIGTFSPVSGQVKRWWGTFMTIVYGNPAKDIQTFLGINDKGDKGAWEPVSSVLRGWAVSLSRISLKTDWLYVILIVLLVTIIFLVIRNSERKGKAIIVPLNLIPLFCGAWLQLVGYHATGYAGIQNWYWAGQLIVIVLLAGVIIDFISGLIVSTRTRTMLMWGVVAVMGFQFSMSYWGYFKTAMPYGYWSPDVPLDGMSQFIEANTEPGSIVGLTGGGNTGYFIHDRTIVNMDGLVNSYPYFQALMSGTAGGYLHNIGLDYVFANPDMLDRIPYNGQFDPYLEATGNMFGRMELFKYGEAP